MISLTSILAEKRSNGKRDRDS